MGAALPDKLRYAFTPSGGYKEGVLYPLVPNDNVGNFEVERTGVATRVNKDGLIEVVDANVPRLDYSDGGCPKLLTEVQSENLITYSEDFSQWTFSGDSLTSNYAISPDGTQNATRVVFSSSDELLRATTTLPMNVTCTASIYIKGNKGDTIQISAGGVDDLKTLSGEWERIETTQTSTSPDMLIDTYGGATARDILVWGGQLEQQPQATSYIPTNGSPQQRGADSVTNAGDSSTFNSESGVLFADVKALSDTSTNNRQLTVSDNTTSNRVAITFPSSGGIRFFHVGDGVNKNFTYTLQDITMQNKLAIVYGNGVASCYVNGLLVSDINNISDILQSKLNTLNLQTTKSVGNILLGKTKSIQHWDYLTDEEMESLTGYQSYAQMTSQFNFNTL